MKKKSNREDIEDKIKIPKEKKLNSKNFKKPSNSRLSKMTANFLDKVGKKNRRTNNGYKDKDWNLSKKLEKKYGKRFMNKKRQREKGEEENLQIFGNKENGNDMLAKVIAMNETEKSKEKKNLHREAIKENNELQSFGQNSPQVGTSFNNSFSSPTKEKFLYNKNTGTSQKTNHDIYKEDKYDKNSFRSKNKIFSVKKNLKKKIVLEKKIMIMKIFLF